MGFKRNSPTTAFQTTLKSPNPAANAKTPNKEGTKNTEGRTVGQID